MSDAMLVASLLQSAMYAAPDGRVQTQFSNLVNTMREAHETDKTIAIAVTGKILDGLRHGNWPEC